MKVNTAYDKMMDTINEGYLSLVNLVNENGGFIDTQPFQNLCDPIYGLDYYEDKPVEVRVLGIRTERIDDEDEIILFVAPSENKAVVDDWEKVKDACWETFYNGEADGYWISLKYSEIYYWATLISILECVEEYV